MYRTLISYLLFQFDFQNNPKKMEYFFVGRERKSGGGLEQLVNSVGVYLLG